MPSPVITGISGIRSNFIVPFGSWLFTKKKMETARPPTKKTVTIFLLDVNENQSMLWMNQLNVV
jgi:hypothetical protein